MSSRTVGKENILNKYHMFSAAKPGQQPRFQYIWTSFSVCTKNVIAKVSQHTEANAQWQSSRTEWPAAVTKVWIYNYFQGREEEAAKFCISDSWEKISKQTKTTNTNKTPTKITINKIVLREKGEILQIKLNSWANDWRVVLPTQVLHRFSLHKFACASGCSCPSQTESCLEYPRQRTTKEKCFLKMYP